MRRRLELTVLARSGALPIVVAAVIAPACGSKSGLLEPPADAAAGATGGFAATGGVSTGGSGGIVFGGGGLGATGGFGATGGVAGSGGQFDCPTFGQLETYTVELPPEGVPADPGQICAVTVAPVESGRAAHVTLTKLGSGDDLSAADGLCEIDAKLLPRVIGTPTLEVLDATYPALMQMQVQGMTKQATGWSFQATFPSPLVITPTSFDNTSPGRMTVRISFELDCSPGGASKVVHAATDIHVCIDTGQVEWVSSGDQCTVCRVIAEMAPSPIVPEPVADELPLARALRLRVVELARISNTLVLFAEHDGGDGFEYEWQASAGRVDRLAPDVVAWTLEEGMDAPFIQATVSGPAALGVVSYGFNEAA